MTVSVVIPVYNAGERLLHALEGVAAQSVQPDQVIVVDDGSDDEAIDHARRAFPGYLYLQQSQAGPSAARNRGIARSTSEWVAFLDADDRWRDDHLNSALQLLADGWVDGIMSNRVDFFDNPQTKPIPAPGYAMQAFEGALDLNRLLELLEHGFYFCQSSVILKRSKIQEGYVQGMNWGEDIELFLRVVAQGGPWLYNPDRTVYYRADTPNGLSRNYAGTALGHFRAIKSVERYLTSPNAVYRRLISASSRRAVLAAIAYESADIQTRTWSEVGGSVSALDKPLIWSLKTMPALAGAIHRKRHQIRQRRILAARQTGGADQVDDADRLTGKPNQPTV